ncbi:hypothetical protein HMPREF1983_00311 [Gemella bergeri ATCC 700627]|uniref:DUF1146 domain-containing protein n=1 Tax=Gemella bergeri ATCC 700627 TaxID=1321820 RepID=U2QBI3_9BACL|nr:DUF1146 family protein [Gemella bergeri]ERK60210.1 hypothetical protein HMPREF1983_00311 [Gemella bergeri ATCC 700627]
MNFIKLTLLFIMILVSNFSLLKLDFGKLFKKNSTKEIKILISLMSFAIGYLGYNAIMTIYELSLHLIK